MSEASGKDIALRDELLELLYWLEGEGLRGSATLAGIIRFLAHPEVEVQASLAQLVRRGDVVVVVEESGGPEYRLTEVGRREAARRFAEDFAPLLGQGHGECNDPECECHTNPAAAAECHAERAGKGRDA